MRDVQVARGLGLFSLGLGAAELFAPKLIAEPIGLKDRPGLVRTFGLREIGSGIAVLSGRAKGKALWGRFVGDLLDLAVLSRGVGKKRYAKGALIAIGMVGFVGLLDFVFARRLP